VKDKIEKQLINMASRIAKQGKGCIFVIKEFGVDYEPLIEQDIKPFSIFENEKRLEALAILDGACIIDLQGNLTAYCVKIMNTRVFSGKGTRHAGAYTASLSGNVVLMASEEDKKVKIFKQGKLVAQLDPLERDAESNAQIIVNYLNDFWQSAGIGAVGALSISTFIPTLGLQVAPGILLFGSVTFIYKLLERHFAPKKLQT
jgi:hypothetical protein